MTLTEAQVNEVTTHLRGQGASEDNVQATLVKLLELSDPPDNLVAWAHTAALRLTISEGRRMAKERLRPWGPDPTLDSLSPDRMYELRDHIARIGPPWKDNIECPHPTRPRYGRYPACQSCYLVAYRTHKRTQKRDAK